MTPEEEQLSQKALEFIKANKQLLLDKFAPSAECKKIARPVSLFMAGSPGAGKTEISIGLMDRFPNSRPVRIDADDIRALCPGYEGTNAHVFQTAATKGVNMLYDYSLECGLNCILDGTFAYANALENISRSLKRGRIVEVWFVYQEPELAWKFTKAREVKESRRVSKETFLKSFFNARENAISAKKQLGGDIKLNLLVKNFDNSAEDIYLNISGAELDRHTACGYSLEELNELLP